MPVSEPASYDFIGPITHQLMRVHINSGRVDIEHPGCDHPADVVPDLDCVYCTKCGLNERVSGAWIMDLVETDSGVSQ